MQTEPRIREAQEADLEQVLEAVEVVAKEEVHIGTEAPIDRESRGRAIKQAYLENKHGLLLVVEDEDRIVGWLNVASSNGLADLGMGLLPAYRGRGIGSLLMERCLAWCRDHGCHKIQLEVWPHNEAAVRLYKRFGFEQEGLKRHHYKRKSGEIWDVATMGLVLLAE